MRAAVYADQIVAGDIRILWVDITSRSGMVLHAASLFEFLHQMSPHFALCEGTI